MKTTEELIQQGIANMQATHASKEKEKQGILRIGSSGILAYGKKVAGSCMRLAFLREQGIEGDAIGEDREHMFAGGRANEDIWTALMESAQEPGLSWKREDEYPVKVVLENGKELTGRPDLVLFKDEKAQRVLELKAASSLYTALNVGINMKPSLSHVIQAIHYGHRLGLPVELWYASRVDFHITEFKKKDFPDNPLTRSRCQWKANWKTGKEEPLKILPFLQGYQLTVKDNGQVCYRALPDGKEVSTIVTVQGIEEYFKQLSTISTSDALPGRISKLDIDGTDSYSKCDYCSLKPVCTEYKGDSAKEWLKKVKEFKK